MSRNAKTVIRGRRAIIEKPVTEATWNRVMEAVASYDALPPELRVHSTHHTNIRKIRGQGA